jgi:putative SOS response-associated peptidase YedK
MCGRFKPKVDNWAELYELLSMFGQEPPQRDLYEKSEIRPTNNYPVIHERLVKGKPDGYEAELMRWSLIPNWFNKNLADFKLTSFNAKIEEAADKPTFRSAMKHRHCVVPVDYFWEWFGPHPHDAKKKQRQDILRADNHEMVFAGIWDTATLADGVTIKSFTLMTRAAGDDLTGYHTREPVTLVGDEIKLWLDRKPVPSIDPVPNEDGEKIWPSATKGTFRFKPSDFIEEPTAPRKPKKKAPATEQDSLL